MATDQHSEQFTPRKIGRWLRSTLDWRAELEAGPRSRSVTDYSKPVVMGGGASAGAGGEALINAARREELEARLRIVDSWLAECSSLELLAADYWLQDSDGTITQVAVAANLEYQQARRLVQCLPLIIWGRFYHGTGQAEQNGAQTDGSANA